MEDNLLCTKSQISELLRGKIGDANSWLMNFEKSAQAWEIAVELIREPVGSQFRTFGAIMLNNKVQRDINQLDQNSINSLTQTLVHTLLSVSNENKYDTIFCRYMCVSIASLAIQVNQDGVIAQILQWMNPILSTNPLIILELLISLPEQCFNRNLDIESEQRDQFAQQLTQSVDEVFAFLDFTRSIAADVVTIQQILKCLERWIHYTRFPASVFQKTQLLSSVLFYLDNGDLFEDAVNVVIAIWRNFQWDDKDLVRTILPKVTHIGQSYFQGQVQLLESCVDGDDKINYINTCRSIACLLTETIEGTLQILVKSAQVDIDITSQLYHILTFLVECVKFKFDSGVSRIPLKLFYDLSHLMKRFQLNGNGQTEVGEDEQYYYRGCDITNEESYLSIYSIFTVLLDVIIRKTEIGEDVFQGRRKITDTEIDMRTDLVDSILDVSAALGEVDCFRQICNYLQVEIETNTRGNNVGWSRIESLLLAIETVVPSLPDLVSNMIREVLSFLDTLPIGIPELQRTIVNIVGCSIPKLSENDRRHNSILLQNLIRKVYFSLEDETLSLSAAKAICNILKCRACIEQIFETDVMLPVRELDFIVNDLRAKRKLKTDTDMMLLEGFCSILSYLSPGDQVKGFEQILFPLVMSLRQQVDDAVNRCTSTNEIKLLEENLDIPSCNADIDRTMIVFKHAKVDVEVLVTYFANIFPTFQKLVHHTSSEIICEKVCRVYKMFARNVGGRGTSSILSALAQHLVEEFRKKYFSAFLYAASICFSVCSRRYENLPEDVRLQSCNLLYNMFWELSQIFFSKCSTLELFEKKPDLVEEYFYLASCALQSFPEPMFLNPTSTTIVQAGIVGLNLRHREAQKGILSFFESLVDAIDKVGVHGLESLRQVGPALIEYSFFALSGYFPAYAVDEQNGCITDVLWKLCAVTPTEFKEWLALIESKLPEYARNPFKSSDMVNVLVDVRSKYEFSRKLNDFAWSCSVRNQNFNALIS